MFEMLRSVLIERVRYVRLEHHTIWDIRGGADTQAEDSEEVLRAEVG